MKRALFILGRAGGRKTEDAAALNRPAFRRRRRPPYFAFCGRHGPPVPEAAYRPRVGLPARRIRMVPPPGMTQSGNRCKARRADARPRAAKYAPSLRAASGPRRPRQPACRAVEPGGLRHAGKQRQNERWPRRRAHQKPGASGQKLFAFASALFLIHKEALVPNQKRKYRPDLALVVGALVEMVV